MVNGELTIKASEMAGAYFRVNVYLYNGRFTKVPESAQILVYGEQPALPEQKFYCAELFCQIPMSLRPSRLPELFP